MKIMTVRAPEEIQHTLSALAREKGITRNALLLIIVDDWIKQRKIEKGSSATEPGT